MVHARLVDDQHIAAGEHVAGREPILAELVLPEIDQIGRIAHCAHDLVILLHTFDFSSKRCRIKRVCDFPTLFIPGQTPFGENQWPTGCRDTAE
ncbi:hypothetical protein BAR24_00575 [Gluconobacter oxydans]|nr:hypothetical protein BAR24_00575 [Gluconobacter oxydans]